jgi:hypothetical protein
VKKAKYYILAIDIPETKDKWIYVIIEDRSTGQIDDYFDVRLSWPSLEMHSVGGFILAGDSFENHLNRTIDDWYMFD